MYGYVVLIRYKIRTKRGNMPHAALTKRAIRLAGTYPCHTNHIESDDVQAKELQTDMGQEERYLSPRPCRLPLTGVALIKMWLCG